MAILNKLKIWINARITTRVKATKRNSTHQMSVFTSRNELTYYGGYKMKLLSSFSFSRSRNPCNEQHRSVGNPKEGPKPRQLLSLPPFPAQPSPSLFRGSDAPPRVTAVSWLKHYFADVPGSVIQSHFNKGLISPNLVMEADSKIYVPVSIAESRISKRFDTIPSGTLYPNADEIEYLQRLVMYKDSAILVLNKPPKLPVKGNLPVHNSMDALAAAALSYGFDDGPKLVHRLDRESSGIHLMGRSKESIAQLLWLFSDTRKAKTSSKTWDDACAATTQKYWALVIGSPKEKEGVIRAPLSKVLLNDGKTERIIIADPSGVEASQEAITEYRVLGPTINGCSWIELCPRTGRKHQHENNLMKDFLVFQLRVHCSEALGTPIVGDYKYGWYVHSKWKQMPRVDIEPTSGKPYKLRRPEGLDVQKGSVLSKVPLLHLHFRELILPNIAKFLEVFGEGPSINTQLLQRRRMFLGLWRQCLHI
ncbi:hypothetical protein Syun_024757 [Stephania yunnanensis]|uniref:Pseudouridine synthase RsuA/RluA-like domain-containing protein n=1 Tax=Stephania yunnanensis TaxID=152371 RepID=A0AAP0EVQ7_9MAGN